MKTILSVIAALAPAALAMAQSYPSKPVRLIAKPRTVLLPALIVPASVIALAVLYPFYRSHIFGSPIFGPAPAMDTMAPEAACDTHVPGEVADVDDAEIARLCGIAGNGHGEAATQRHLVLAGR